GWPAWLALAGAEAIENKTRSLWFDTQIMTLRLAAYGCGEALAHRRLLDSTQSLVAPFTIECTTEEQFWPMRTARRAMRKPARQICDFLADAEAPDYKAEAMSGISPSSTKP